MSNSGVSLTVPSAPVAGSTTAPVRAIVVGTGKWGTNLAREAHALGSLAALVDSNERSLQAAFSSLGTPSAVGTYPTLTLALRAHPSAPVIVATPPRTHYDVALAALHAGRDVWVEKPLCLTLAHAEQLAASADAGGRILFVDHLLQYSSPHARLLKLVRDGFVGRVTRVRARRLNFGTVRTQENVLWSFCPHDVSLALAAVGRLPSSVLCTGQAAVSRNVEDYVDLQLSFSQGVTASIEASWLHFEKERGLAVFGSEGCLAVDEVPKDGKPALTGFKWSAKRRADGCSVVTEKREVALTDDADDRMRGSPIRNALGEFFECVRTRRSPITDGREGIRVLGVLLAAQESLATAAAVRVAEGRSPRKVERSLEVPSTGRSAPPSAGGLRGGGSVGRAANSNGAPPGPLYFKHPSAVVDAGAAIGPDCRVWHFSHIMSGAVLGRSCNIGQNVYLAATAVLGSNVKVQNGVSIYDGVTVDDDAFLGPHCVFTNVKTPRSHVSRRDAFEKTRVGRGATVGANATVVCGTRLGEYCMVGAGAVVTKDVPSHALVYGNPARVMGWVATGGQRLVVVGDMGDGRHVLQCRESGEVYHLHPPEAGREAYVVRDMELDGEPTDGRGGAERREPNCL